jgi:hypothetical protein
MRLVSAARHVAVSAADTAPVYPACDCFQAKCAATPASSIHVDSDYPGQLGIPWGRILMQQH